MKRKSEKVPADKRYYAIALINCDNPDFFTDSVFESQNDAVEAFLSDSFMGQEAPNSGEYVLIEVTRVQRLDTYLKARLAPVDIDAMVERNRHHKDTE